MMTMTRKFSDALCYFLRENILSAKAIYVTNLYFQGVRHVLHLQLPLGAMLVLKRSRRHVIILGNGHVIEKTWLYAWERQYTCHSSERWISHNGDDRNVQKDTDSSSDSGMTKRHLQHKLAYHALLRLNSYTVSDKICFIEREIRIAHACMSLFIKVYLHDNGVPCPYQEQ